jgi:DNA polymerase-3 subunit beta
MKVTLERNALLKSLSHVHRVVERRNTYPILANVLLKAADGRVDLRATDLDIEVTESVPAMVSTRSTKSSASWPMAPKSGSRPRAASKCC